MLSVGFSGRAEGKAAGYFTLVVCVSEECMVAFGVDRCRLGVPVVTAVNALFLLKCPVCCCWGWDRGLCVRASVWPEDNFRESVLSFHLV